MISIRGASRYLLFVILGLILFCEHPEEFHAMRQTSEYSFKCILEAEESYILGESVNLKFMLKNQTDRTQFVLKWYTPLEGIFGEIFRVMKNGKNIPYRGILAKRGEPRREDYIRIEPGENVSAEVDIATSWDLSKVGKYRVEFISKLYDVTDNESLIPKRQNAHQSQKILCNAVQFKIITSHD